MTKSKSQKDQRDTLEVKAESKKRPEAYSNGGPISSDDPIYTSGHMMLRPIRGKAKDQASDPEGVTKVSESSVNND